MKYIKTKYQIVESFYLETLITGYLVECEFFTLHMDGELDIWKGFCFDGATGYFDVEKILVASAEHDIFTWLINEGYLRQHEQALADEQFRLRQEAAGMSKVMRFLTYSAVRIFQILKKPGQKVKVYEVAH